MLNKTLKFEDIINFTRASTATYWDSAGVLQTAAIDGPRFDHDPATGDRLGFLIEEQRTNSLPNSRDLTGWANVGDSSAELDAIGLDGVGNSASTVSTSDIAARIQTNVSWPASVDVLSISIFVKKGLSQAFEWQARGSVPITYATVDLNTGTIVDSDGDVYIEDAGDWWRVYLITTTDGSGGVVQLRLFPDREEGDKSVVVDGLQVEEGAFPTSPIFTSGATATRSAEAALIDPLTPWFAESPNMTLFCDWIPRAVPSMSSRWHMLRLGVSLVNGQYGFYNTMNGIARDGDGNLEITNFTYSKGELMKTALLIRDGVVFFGVDGVLEESSVSGNNAVNSTFLELGGGATVAGHLQDVLFYPHALSDEEVLEGIS